MTGTNPQPGDRSTFVNFSPRDEVVAKLNDVLRAQLESATRGNASGPQSWPFRLAARCWNLCGVLFGIFSRIFLLAVIANVPLLQLIGFGYLLDAGGRAARGDRWSLFRESLTRASRLGGILLGAWLLIWPVRIVSGFWLDASIIDPTSEQTAFLKVLQWVFLVATVAHVIAAILCGGKLRYFFWPLVAPFSIFVWLVRRSSATRKILEGALGWLMPKFVADICSVKPIGDWFLPAIFVKKLFVGELYGKSRDAVWDFLAGFEPVRYFLLGLKGFGGTLVWLALPTLLLAGANSEKQGMAGLFLLLGLIVSIPVFTMLPFLQANFAIEGKFRRFFEVRNVLKQFGRAPFAHLLSLLLILVLAVPLFLLKIEQIPAELMWTLSLLFIALGWPSHWLAGWAVRRSAKKEKPVRWWIRYPVQFLAGPVSFAFAVFFFLSRYVSWNGTLSLLENHVFLMPVPFWLG